jgi:hypothetical protein
LLKLHGYNTAQEFNRRLKEYIKSKKKDKSDSRAGIWNKDFE